MITDKELNPCPFCGGIPHTVDSEHTSNGLDGVICGKCDARIFGRDCVEKWNTRAESAEQAREEAAERVAYAWREHGENITLRIIHDAILSTVNESFTVAPVSTDAEKLSIAVKALESASIGLAVRDGDYETLSLIRQALKEIQG